MTKLCLEKVKTERIHGNTLIQYILLRTRELVQDARVTLVGQSIKTVRGKVLTTAEKHGGKAD